MGVKQNIAHLHWLVATVLYIINLATETNNHQKVVDYLFQNWTFHKI